MPVESRIGDGKSDVDGVGNAKEGLHGRDLKLILLDNFVDRRYLCIFKLCC